MSLPCDNSEAAEERRLFQDRQFACLKCLGDLRAAIFALDMAAERVSRNEAQPEPERTAARDKCEWCDRAIAHLSVINQL